MSTSTMLTSEFNTSDLKNILKNPLLRSLKADIKKSKFLSWERNALIIFKKLLYHL